MISLFPDKALVVGGVIVLKSLLLPPLGLSLLDLLPPKDGSVYFLACLACLFSWYLCVSVIGCIGNLVGLFSGWDLLPATGDIILAGIDKDCTADEFKSGLAALGDALTTVPPCCEAPLKFISASLAIMCILACIGTNFLVS